MSNNIILSYPNRANAATITGGSWLAGLPASNLANREMWKVARSANALTTSTKFNVDIGAVKPLRAFALANHNLSASATWRVTLGTAAGASDVYDSGFSNVWRMAFGDLVEWESVTWWTGTAGDEYLRSPYAAMCVADDTYSARYVTIEINDTANVDGYVQIGRMFAGGALQPTYNASYGLQDGVKDLSSTDSAESGALWGTERRRMRYTSLVLGYVTPDEASYVHEMQRLLGTLGEVLYIPYPADMGQSQRYGYLGRLSELSAIEYPHYRIRSLPIKIEELA
jgi:hypothetical protein